MLRYPRQDMAQNKNINNKKSNISDSEALKVASQILIEISRAFTREWLVSKIITNITIDHNY